MKALISLALMLVGVYLAATSAAGLLSGTGNAWEDVARFSAGALFCFLAIPVGLSAGTTSNRYHVQTPSELPHRSAAHGYEDRRDDDDDYQRPAITGHFTNQEEREAARCEYQRKVWLEEIAGSEAATGAPEDQARWWEKPSIRRIDDTQPPDPPKKNDGDLRDLNDDDWRRMGLR